jgi:hypothetical protein
VVNEDFSDYKKSSGIVMDTEAALFEISGKFKNVFIALNVS